MKAIVQRVSQAAVKVDDRVAGQIDRGLLVFVGVIEGDSTKQVQWMAKKLPALRIFPDDEDKMNRSLVDIDGGMLLISNFTLGARCKKGTRPNFMNAAEPMLALDLFNQLASLCGEQVTTATGEFGAKMVIDAQFDGPITLIVDTEE